jgi:uncharacterized protein (DUF2235 family)
LRQNAKAVFELATGYGLDADILGAYAFICRHYAEDDAIFLFGFSRGAYTVRAVAGMIHMIGLLAPDQLNIAGYALRAYKQASDGDDFSIAWHFSKVAGTQAVRIKFLGVWDTVASVLVPRRDRIVPQLLTLPYTRKNPSVAVFRQAMAIDERRRMFRLNRWIEPQPFVQNPFNKSAKPTPQDSRQVWFAGGHGDIGGGYPEDESGAAKFPLDWMIGEATAHGLQINPAMRNHLILGRPRAGVRTVFVKPDATAPIHESLTWAWRPLEWIPKSARWREWPRPALAGVYLPRAEPRMIADDKQRPIIHESVLDRMNSTNYRPENFPTIYDVEPT